MKWLIRLAFPALGFLVLLILFGINDPDEVTAPVASSSPDKLQDIPAFEGLVPSPVPTNGPDIVFKWQDNDGNWHYADQPPVEGPWNTLAIERPEKGRDMDPETDWQSPYSAPFSLGPNNRVPSAGS